MVLWAPSEAVAVRVFPTELSSHALQPTMGNPVLHYWTLNHTGQGTLNTSAYADTTLSPTEFLFIPHTHLVGLRAASVDAFDKRPSLLRACFFDGSNLNDVRDALGTEGLLHEASLRLVSVLMKHGIDLTMQREVPPRTTVKSFRTFPRPIGEGGGSTPAEPAESEEGGGGGGRKTRGRKDFRGECTDGWVRGRYVSECCVFLLLCPPSV